MPQGTPERPNVGPAAPTPCAIDNAGLSAAVRLSMPVPMLGVMLSPALSLAAIATPALRAAADSPLAATQLVVGLGLWAALFIVPTRPLLQRFGSQRRVGIAGGTVSVRDRTIPGARAWQGPRNAFRGIACPVRSSLSGVRHGLHLVHIDPGKSLLLHGADPISEATIAAGALLRLPLLAAVTRQCLGERARRRPLSSLWRLFWPHPLRIGPLWPARCRQQTQRSVG